jgi:hypothetical protein
MRVIDLSPKAANALLYLAFSGGELQGTRLDPKFRNELGAARFVEKRKVGREPETLHLSEVGWAALAQEFPDLPKSGRKQAIKRTTSKRKSKHKPTKLAEIETLNVVLVAVRGFLDTSGLSLVDLVSGGRSSDGTAGRRAANPSSGASNGGRAANDDANVLRTYLAIAKRWGEEVRLAVLRRELPNMAREHLDAALRRLREQGRLTPYPIESARELRAEDEDAALLLGMTRHHYVRIQEA